MHEGGSFPTFRLIWPDQSEYAISKRGPCYMGEISYFVTQALKIRMDYSNNNLRVSNIRVSKRTLIYNVCSKSALT